MWKFLATLITTVSHIFLTWWNKKNAKEKQNIVNSARADPATYILHKTNAVDKRQTFSAPATHEKPYSDQ